MKKIFLVLYILTVSLQGFSKEWKLSNANLEVVFDDQTSLLTIKDRRCLKVWRQSALSQRLEIDKVSQSEKEIKIDFKGSPSLNVRYLLTSTSSLEVILNADKSAAFESLAFPSAFQTPDKNHHLLYTDGEGFLLPVNDKEYPIGRNRMYSMTGLSMPWMGIIDANHESGYMAVLETPDDSEINVKRGQDSLITFEPVWLSSKGTFAYSRKVSYHFFDKGGYVAQCKKYREYVWKNAGSGITLKEKQKQFPTIEKMVGSVHIYLWDDARELSFANELKQSGISKASIFWNPNHPPYPEAGYDNTIKKLEYFSGVYELFRDAKLRDTVGKIRPNNREGTWLNRFSFPGLFKQITLVQKDGSLHYSGFGYDINPKAILPLIPSLRTDQELKVYPHESVFSDGFLASGIFEDYGKTYPLTRSEYKQSVVDIHNLFINKYKMVVGIEWGADYGVPTSAYAHGMTTLHRMLYRSKDRQKKGSIYYEGAWGNPSRPSVMVGEYTADKNYMRWAINEKIRVPLYQLVYHDAIVTTWRWDDANHHMPEIWWKKDLFNILYGTAPVWTMDRPRWNKFKQTFIESYKTINPWLQEVGYDEMTNHRFVTKNGVVQEASFSSGKKVVVNLGDDDYKLDDKIVKARGYLTF